MGVVGLGFDLDEHAGGDDEAIEGLDGAGGGFHDVDDAFVGADFELFTGFFVDVGGAEDGEFFDTGGERNRAADFGGGTLGVIDDFLAERSRAR